MYRERRINKLAHTQTTSLPIPMHLHVVDNNGTMIILLSETLGRWVM